MRAKAVARAEQLVLDKLKHRRDTQFREGNLEDSLFAGMHTHTYC